MNEPDAEDLDFFAASLGALSLISKLRAARSEAAALRAENGASVVVQLKHALREIGEGKGRFSRDPLTHASNTIDDMKAIAAKALSATWSCEALVCENCGFVVGIPTEKERVELYQSLIAGGLGHDEAAGTAWPDLALRAAQAADSEDGIKRLRELLEAYDAGNLEMNSPEIDGDGQTIPAHPWHEEWLHLARKAVAARRQPTEVQK